MDALEIKRFLNESNPHWSTGTVELRPSLKNIYRPQFDLVKSQMEKTQCLGLLGLRRVGKSVIMSQMMEYLCREHSPKNICSVSFDEELIGKNPDILEQIIKGVLEEADKEKRFFFFIDEIQFVNNWQHIIKRYYDRNLNLKFIVSGSSSLFIRKRTTESLAGRIIEFVIPPVSFWEFLALSGRGTDVAGKLSALKIDFEFFDETQVFKTAKDVLVEKPSIGSLFDEYLACRQFPEIAAWPEGEAYEYVRTSVYKKTLLYDIPRLFDIRHPDEIAFLYNILMRESANLLEVGNLARDAGINRNTVSTYLAYLKEALLHISLPNATSSIREQRRLLRKGYVASPNFSATLLRLSPTHPLWQQESGHFAETFAANILWNKYEDTLKFYRKGDMEVDFVVSKRPGQLRGSLPIEVKYSDEISSRDLKGLISLGKKTGSKECFCITKNVCRVEMKEGIKIICVPIWLI